MTALNLAPEEIIKTIEDKNNPMNLGFNVMLGRNVKESFNPLNYDIRETSITSRIERTYMSEMKKSPDHVIFFTMAMHAQKMLYIYLCNRLGAEYSADAAEIAKVWPTEFSFHLPKIVDDPEIIQTVKINSITKRKEPGSYMVSLSSTINELELSAPKCVVYVEPEYADKDISL